MVGLFCHVRLTTSSVHFESGDQLRDLSSTSVTFFLIPRWIALGRTDDSSCCKAGCCVASSHHLRAHPRIPIFLCVGFSYYCYLCYRIPHPVTRSYIKLSCVYMAMCIFFLLFPYYFLVFSLFLFFFIFSLYDRSSYLFYVLCRRVDGCHNAIGPAWFFSLIVWLLCR